jgi:hypothetical protein
VSLPLFRTTSGLKVGRHGCGHIPERTPRGGHVTEFNKYVAPARRDHFGGKMEKEPLNSGSWVVFASLVSLANGETRKVVGASYVAHLHRDQKLDKGKCCCPIVTFAQHLMIFTWF